MIHVDESDPVGELEPSFPYRDVTIKRGVEATEFYELEEEIGRGKFGTVYKCREKATGLRLAAKFVPVPRREDRRNVEREVDIMRQLQHPRLIQLYDAFDNGKVMCVVLELIEGGELFERVIDDDFILTEKSCTVFMRQICEGIEFIHKQNILHLDMKPENILCLTKTGNRIKIIDFGLARRYDPNKKLQVLFGTPEFVAPEVVNFDQIGYGTDMWSVGVICYVLLSGLSPFMGETDIETMANVTIAKYDFDDEAFNKISDEAKDFITKLLVKDKEARMSATECLKHPWLRRKTPPQVPNNTPLPLSELETTKENLRLFVERWGEHPNSPYLCDNQIICPEPNRRLLCASQHSLNGMSPSPCGSLESSPSSVTEHDLDEIEHKDKNKLFEHVQLERRASDSSCVLKSSDVAEKISLAEEIKKLSDQLFKLATMPTELVNGGVNFNKLQVNDIKTNSSQTKISKTVVNNSERTVSDNIRIPHSSNHAHAQRRSKFKVTGLSRDVPYLSPTNKSGSFFNDEFFKSNCSSQQGSLQNSATSTKDLLLKLLDKWDDTLDHSNTLNGRHKSISIEWSENENLAQKTLSSLNTFFQSRQTSKKSHPFMSSN